MMMMIMMMMWGSVEGEKSILLIRIQGWTLTAWLPLCNSSLINDAFHSKILNLKNATSLKVIMLLWMDFFNLLFGSLVNFIHETATNMWNNILLHVCLFTFLVDKSKMWAWVSDTVKYWEVALRFWSLVFDQTVSDWNNNLTDSIILCLGQIFVQLFHNI